MKKRVLCLLLTLVMVLALLPTAYGAEDYRAWSQSDSRWGSIQMGTSGLTISNAGCLVTSVTKLIIQAGLKDSGSFNVATLSKFLNNNTGYVPGTGNLYYSAPTKLVPGFVYYGTLISSGSYSSTEYNNSFLSWIKSGLHMAINVSGGGHWVAVDEAKSLATGKVYIMDSSGNLANSDITLTARYPSFNSIIAWTGGSTPSTTCKHTYSNYVCTKCGAWDESSVKTSSVNSTFAATGSGIVRSGPYSGCSKLKTLNEGTIINATQKVANAQGNVWYRLTDGGYIYSSNVKAVSVPPVSFTDVAVSNNHYIYSVTEYNALLVVTIKPNISGIVCTKEGIELYDSSGTISSSHLLKKFNFTDRLGFNPAIYVSFDMNAEVGYTLSPGTKYYYRFYAEIDNGSSCSIYYSDTYSCTTAQVSHTHSYGSAWKSDGTNHWHECSCGAKSSTAAHSYGSWVTTTAATHTSAGSKYRACSVCGYKQTQSISATGHSYGSAWKYDGTNHWHECSCGAKSSTAAHSYGSWVTTTAATHTSAGSKYRTCSVCGYKQTETIGKPLAHTYNLQIATDLHLASAATCTKAATYYYSCECGDNGSEVFSYGNPLGHNFVNGECSRCPVVDPYVIHTGTCGSNLTWKLNLSTSTLTISGVGEMWDYTARHFPWSGWEDIKYVVIESGVTSISERAFYEMKNLISATIPNSVTSIESAAFCYCRNLVDVYVPSSVISIGDDAFSACTNLRTITVSTSNNQFTSENGVLFNKDKTVLIQYPAGCQSSTYEIPKSVTKISHSAFVECSNLTSIVIPNGVTSIGSYAFFNCDNLNSVVISESVISVGGYAFKGTPWIEAQGEFVIVNGNLLAYQGNSSDVTIPDNVVTICQYAFSNCTSIVDLTIPEGVQKIYSYAFSNCSNLACVTMPTSLKSTFGSIFDKCNHLTSIYISDLTAWCGIDFWHAEDSGLRYAHDLYLNGQLITDLVIPEGVKEIKAGPFSYDTNLTSVTFPSSVISIMNSSFRYCSKLSSAIFVGNAPKIFEQGVFISCPADLTIYAPENNTTWTSSSAYDAQAQTWNGFPIKFYHVHSYSSNTVAPTCESQGYTEYTCSCGDNYKDNYTSATGHHYVNGKCVDCGQAQHGGNSGLAGLFAGFFKSIRSFFSSLFSWLPF